MQNTKSFNSTNSELWTVKQVADYLQTSPKSIYAYMAKNGVRAGNARRRIPSHIYIKIGRKILFIKSELISWVIAGARMEIITAN